MISEKFSGFDSVKSSAKQMKQAIEQVILWFIIVKTIRTRNSKGLGRKADLSLMKMCIVGRPHKKLLLHLTFKVTNLMYLACHKKRCLICVEFSNFRNITEYLFWFFFKVQNWDSQQGRDSCLKINKYYVIFENSTHTKLDFLMRNQGH